MDNNILLVGDSLTAAANAWPSLLESTLNSATPGTEWHTTNIAQGGNTAAAVAAGIDAAIASITSLHGHVLINLGVNGPIDAGVYETSMQSIIDSLLSKWPTTKIYLMRPWKRDWDAAADAYAAVIDDLVTANAGSVFLGPDERVWKKGADNGATMTTDGVHYSAAAQTELGTVQWPNVLP